MWLFKLLNWNCSSRMCFNAAQWKTQPCGWYRVTPATGRDEGLGVWSQWKTVSDRSVLLDTKYCWSKDKEYGGNSILESNHTEKYF